MPIIPGSSLDEPKSILIEYKQSDCEVEKDEESVNSEDIWEGDYILVPLLTIQGYREYHIEDKEICTKCASERNAYVISRYLRLGGEGVDSVIDHLVGLISLADQLLDFLAFYDLRVVGDADPELVVDGYRVALLDAEGRAQSRL